MIGEKMGILKKLFCAEKRDNQPCIEISDEEYEALIERARKIDEAQRERMEYLKKHDKSKTWQNRTNILYLTAEILYPKAENTNAQMKLKPLWFGLFLIL